MSLPYTLTDNRPAQIGLIVLQADETLERDMRQLLPEDMELLVSRVPSLPAVSSQGLRQMADHLTEAAALLPRGAQLGAVGYGCTSGTAEMGAERIARLIRDGVDTPAVTEPLSALLAICEKFDIKSLGMISPYVAEVSQSLRNALAQAGVAVTAFESFDEEVEERVVRIASDAIIDAAVALGRSSDCEAIFLSCTNLRTLDVIQEIESETNKPVLSSNQVLAWHLCQLTGHRLAKTAPGRLR